MRLRRKEAIAFALLGVAAIAVLVPWGDDEPSPAPKEAPPHAGEPRPGEPPPEEPQPGEPQPGEPQPGEPQPGEPQPGEPQPGEPAPEDPAARRARQEAEQRQKEAAALLDEARATQDARRAIEVLEAASEEILAEASIRAALAGLKAEIASLDTVPSPRHPRIEQVQKDIEGIAAARARMPALRESNAGVAEVADLLDVVLADAAIRGFIEDFFAPALPEDVTLEAEALAALPPDAATGVFRRAFETLGAEQVRDLGVPLADRFIAQDRGRTRIRWLLRIWRQHAADPAITESLARAWMAQNRVFAAQMTLRTGPATGSLDYLRLRAIVSGYASAPKDEAAAWEALGTDHMTRAELDRLLTLYGALGNPAKAFELARKLLAENPSRERTEDAINRALALARIDDALELVSQAAQLYPPARFWLEWGYEIAIRDLQTETSIQYLEQLFQLFPTGRFEREGQAGAYWEILEKYYIRNGMDLRRAALLESRLEKMVDPGVAARLREQLITLYLVLQDENAARGHLRDAVIAAPSVKEILPLLGNAVGLQATEAIAAARQRLVTDEMSSEDAESLYDSLEATIAPGEKRGVLEVLYGRHPDNEGLRTRLLLALDAEDPLAAAALEEARARANPENADLVRAWVLRASWTQDTDLIIRAREALVRAAPEDVVNRRLLAQLYSGRSDMDAARAQYAAIYEIGIENVRDFESLIDILLFQGDLQTAARYMRKHLAENPTDRRVKFRLADLLAQTDEKAEALVMLRELAQHPDATREEKLALGSALLGEGLHDEALGLYRGLLEANPDDLLAKLRLAQTYTWSSQPRTAEPILTEFIQDNPSGESKETDRLLAEARFTRGEVWWALERESEAEHETRMAERALAAVPDPDIVIKTMHAKTLARLGRTRESERIFSELIAGAPKEVGILIDQADARMSAKRWGPARAAIERARRLRPKNRRMMRLDASLRIPEKRYESSAQILRQLMRETKPTALDHAELGSALRESGRTRAAEVAFASALRKDISREWFYESWRELHFDAGPTAGPYFEYRRSGEDEFTRAGIEGHMILPGDRWRVAANVGWVRSSGSANIPDTRRIREELVRADTELAYRFCRKCWVFAGLSGLVANDEGDFPVGGRIGLRMLGANPFINIEADLHANILLDEVPAAPALGGRKDGVRIQAYREMTKCGWVSVLGSLDQFRIQAPGRGEIADGWLQWQFEAGYRLIGQEKGLSIRGAYSGSRLLDDRALAEVIPLGKRADRLTGGIRLTWSWQQVMDAVVEVYAGTDAASSGSLWGVEGSATLWPHRDLRVRIRAGYGNQDEFQDGEFGHIGLALDARF